MEQVIKLLPKLLKDLGAKVISIGVKPNGLNINENVDLLTHLKLNQL